MMSQKVFMIVARMNEFIIIIRIVFVQTRTKK